MTITLHNIGKRYNFDWIFRNVNYQFQKEQAYVILGKNGSGKSTLLQTIAGNFKASEGDIEYKNESLIPAEEFFRHISFAAPYLELFEQFTLRESIDFHFRLKNSIDNKSTEELISLSQLADAADKQLKYFSSGMKQRARLLLAITTDSPVLLLDEPSSNLDHQGIEWYQQLIKDFKKDRLCIVASNRQEHEYFFCKEEVNVEEYKTTLSV